MNRVPRLRSDIKFQDIRSGDVARVRWPDGYRDCPVTSVDRFGTHSCLKTRSIRVHTPNGGVLTLTKSQADSIMGIVRKEGR